MLGVCRVMPFYCGKRSAGIWVVLGSKQSRPPHHLGGAHKHGATYSSHRAPSTYSSDYASGFFRACGLASASISFPSQRRITRTDPSVEALLPRDVLCAIPYNGGWQICLGSYFMLSPCPMVPPCTTVAYTPT